MFAPRWVSAWFAIGCLACGDDEPAQPPDGGKHNAAVDAGRDARVDASDAPVDAGPDGSPFPGFDASSWSNLDASIFDDILKGCLSSVAAECDGPEDCPDGRICCASLDPAAGGYRDIECAQSCNLNESQFALCHPRAEDDFTCSADGSLRCRRSVLLPQDFIGICAPESPFTPTGMLRGESVRGQIECGESRCDVGTEKCCMTVSLDIAGDRNLARSAACVPFEADCTCELRPEPPEDAGADATLPVPDAMTIDDDAGP